MRQSLRAGHDHGWHNLQDWGQPILRRPQDNKDEESVFVDSIDLRVAAPCGRRPGALPTRQQLACDVLTFHS